MISTNCWKKSISVIDIIWMHLNCIQKTGYNYKCLLTNGIGIYLQTYLNFVDIDVFRW